MEEKKKKNEYMDTDIQQTYSWKKRNIKKMLAKQNIIE